MIAGSVPARKMAIRSEEFEFARATELYKNI
jgi:hypothetical protein